MLFPVSIGFFFAKIGLPLTAIAPGAVTVPSFPTLLSHTMDEDFPWPCTSGDVLLSVSMPFELAGRSPSSSSPESYTVPSNDKAPLDEACSLSLLMVLLPLFMSTAAAPSFSS
uniref:Secreted protein n=1 Tax=Arundo donax TaxID=35708 RepID=A0A0A9CQV9_ARUDO